MEQEFVRREAVIETVKGWGLDSRQKSEEDAIGDIRSIGRAAPAAWIPAARGSGYLICSHCRSDKVKLARAWASDYADIYNFCPVCGTPISWSATMRIAKARNMERNGSNARKIIG